MSEFSADKLAEMVIAALERTAFVLAEPVESDRVASLPAPAHAAVIGYTGPKSGSVRLEATEGFLREVASSLLGVEPHEVDVEKDGLDVIRELANIVGGSVLLELGGDACPFSLGLPEVTALSKGATSDDCVCHIESDGEHLRVFWHAEAAAIAA